LRTAALALAVLLLLAGCSAGYQETAATGSSGSEVSPAVNMTAMPNSDRLGWEAGYDVNATLALNTTDGLNKTELNAVVARAMARIELIRGLEFEQTVPVEIISRAEYRERDVFGSDGTDSVADQSYEALFLVGEDRTASQVRSELTGAGVVGYYSPSENRIVIVSDSPAPQIRRATLVHELAHALQHQQLTPSYRVETGDERLAGQSLVEGDAVTVEREYQSRCGANWTCIAQSSSGTQPAGPIARNPGVYLTLLQPYITGPEFIAALRARSDGTWDAVNDAFSRVPNSTEQIIHPEAYPENDQRTISVADRSTEAWVRMGSDTLGEARIHVMFWNERFVPRPDDAIRTDYTHNLSAGWGNDQLVAYSHTTTDETGYVWQLTWDSPAEAAEFHRGYSRMLRLKLGGDRVRGQSGVYVIDRGPFADAFYIRRDGDTVTVVNGPTVSSLARIGGEGLGA
jgi:hypothetical protein